MKILDKILIGILSVFAGAFGIALISAAIGWPISSAVLQRMIEGLQNFWISVLVCVCALIIIAIAVRLLIAWSRKDTNRRNKVTFWKADPGE